MTDLPTPTSLLRSIAQAGVVEPRPEPVERLLRHGATADDVARAYEVYLRETNAIWRRSAMQALTNQASTK